MKATDDNQKIRELVKMVEAVRTNDERTLTSHGSCTNVHCNFNEQVSSPSLGELRTLHLFLYCCLLRLSLCITCGVYETPHILNLLILSVLLHRIQFPC